MIWVCSDNDDDGKHEHDDDASTRPFFSTASNWVFCCFSIDLQYHGRTSFSVVSPLSSVSYFFFLSWNCPKYLFYTRATSPKHTVFFFILKLDQFPNPNVLPDFYLKTPYHWYNLQCPKWFHTQPPVDAEVTGWTGHCTPIMQTPAEQRFDCWQDI